ncbi:cell division protein FtsL [Candidatus Pelagibacter sp.]|nr:cell division protein FtsL [Candidatus Pelagibacter sp.]
MKKFALISLILFLILFTALIKNSTKRINDIIFIAEENIRSLRKDYENIKLEYEYLSSTENLLKFQNLYFDDELKKKNIQEIKIISKRSNKLEIKELRFINE